MAIKMRVIDWWQPDTEKKFNTNPFINLLRQKYEVIYSDTPDFVLCGPFGSAHLNYDCVKIYYTGENLRVDWNLYDYGMGFDYMDFGERYLHLPLFFIYNYDFTKRDLGERKRFCAYIVRHSGANEWGKDGGLRDRFFDKLSEYKRVDSGGKWRNNIGGAVENKGEWLKDYKFNICFENSSSPGYLTEKLFDAYNAGCVPIYWGDTSLNSSYGELNSSSGASCGDLADFGHCADSSPVLHPKSAKNSTTSTAIRRICEQSEATNTRICDSNQVDSSYSKNSPSLAEGARRWVKTHSLLDSADSQNLVKNNLARSANPCKSFCYFWLLPKEESLPLPLNPNLPNNADSANQTQNAESAPFCHPKSFSCHSKHCEESKKNLSLRADSQNLRGNPPYEKSQNPQNRLPRSHSLARNDKNLDSSLRKCSAQNDNLTQSAESSLDSANSQNLKRGGGFDKKQQENSQNLAHESQNLDKIDTRIPRISTHLLEYKINPKAFINAHNFPNLDALVAEVKRIDNDEIAYNAMRNEPIFLDNFNPKAFYEKRVLEFFDSIFSQNPSEAFRRGEGLLLQGYRNGMRNARECAHLCKDAIRLAQGYDFIRKGIRKVRNKLKFWRAFS